MSNDPLDPLQPPPPHKPPPPEEDEGIGMLLLKAIGAIFAIAFIAVGLLFGSCLLR